MRYSITDGNSVSVFQNIKQAYDYCKDTYGQPDIPFERFLPLAKCCTQLDVYIASTKKCTMSAIDIETGHNAYMRERYSLSLLKQREKYEA